MVYFAPDSLPPQVRRVVDRVGEFMSDCLASETRNPPLADECPGGRCSVEMPALASLAPPIPPERVAVDPAAPQVAAPTESVDAAALRPLLAQLIDFGVGEYELRRWGSSGNLYRFRCAAPLAGDLQHSQQFEAIAASPTETVQQVLADVAAWRLARHDTRLTR